MQGRQKLEREAAELTTLRAEAVETALARLTAGAAVLVLAAGGAAMLVAFRSRRLRQRQMRKVREQIARDLHDEVGSNLASISLISGASEPSEPAADLSRDLSEVHRIAVETNDALRDIVWLLHMDRTSAADLVDRMRSVAHRLLKSTAYSFDFTPELSSPALTLTMRKNALLAFKEALTNVIRHSAATEVKVHVAAGPSRFRFTVVDNGIGFCRDSQPPGDGIRNIECRAAELNGTMLIRTAPGHGATVEFEFPTRAQTRNRKAK
jgi:signal transduction histidine kinase